MRKSASLFSLSLLLLAGLVGCASRGPLFEPKSDGPAAETPAQQTSGSIDKNAIRETIRSHERNIRDCYERAIENDPKLTGKVVLLFHVNPKGHVEKVEESSSEPDIKNAGMMKCLLTTSKTWLFPKNLAGPGETVVISYPFKFMQ